VAGIRHERDEKSGMNKRCLCTRAHRTAPPERSINYKNNRARTCDVRNNGQWCSQCGDHNTQPQTLRLGPVKDTCNTYTRTCWFLCSCGVHAQQGHDA